MLQVHETSSPLHCLIGKAALSECPVSECGDHCLKDVRYETERAVKEQANHVCPLGDVLDRMVTGIEEMQGRLELLDLQCARSGQSNDRPQKEQLLTVKEVATVLRVSRSTAYRLIAKGEVKSVKLGGAVRVRPEHLDSYLDDQARKLGAQPKAAQRRTKIVLKHLKVR